MTGHQEDTARAAFRNGVAGAEVPNFQPRIVGVLCNWCSYSGADMAGQAKLRYPSNLLILRVMCSGRVDTTLVLNALARGADGVLV